MQHAVGMYASSLPGELVLGDRMVGMDALVILSRSLPNHSETHFDA